MDKCFFISDIYASPEAGHKDKGVKRSFIDDAIPGAICGYDTCNALKVHSNSLSDGGFDGTVGTFDFPARCDESRSAYLSCSISALDYLPTLAQPRYGLKTKNVSTTQHRWRVLFCPLLFRYWTCKRAMKSKMRRERNLDLMRKTLSA